MFDADAGRCAEDSAVQTDTQTTGPATDLDDPASRAADQATELYAVSEHERRRNRFDRAIRLAREP